MRHTVQFVRSGQIVELNDIHPTTTVLDYLRLTERKTGTKEGCYEGDCGACTVAIGSLVNGKIVYEPVNACILLIGMLNGKELVTVEDLAINNELHPVQQAMVEQHGSQCGFCTPGFVMSLFTLYHSQHQSANRNIVNDWLSGNLCRCTGYRPIIEAAYTVCFEQPNDTFIQNQQKTIILLKKISQNASFKVGQEKRFFAAPSTIHELSELYSTHPDAVLVSGATDVGIWVNKELQEIQKIIWLGQIPELQKCEELENELCIGATATYSDATELVTNYDQDLGRLWRRIGSRQVRAVGTIGGNIANGSPIGDTIPALICLDTKIELQKQNSTRTIPLEEFFIDYGQQDIKDSEFITFIHIPILPQNTHFRCFKISKRFDQDISALMGAFCITIDATQITKAKIAFGGMASIPKRSQQTESALIGANPADPKTWDAAINALALDFQPINDFRASADYRLKIAKSLLVKALMEISGTEDSTTRLPSYRDMIEVFPGETHAETI